MSEKELKVAEDRAIEEYKDTLHGKPPTSVQAFRAGFRYGYEEGREAYGRESVKVDVVPADKKSSAKNKPKAEPLAEPCEPEPPKAA